MKSEVTKMLKELGYTIKSTNRHIKAIDKEGNIRIFSTKVLNQAIANPKYMRRIDRTSIYKKNRSDAKEAFQDPVIYHEC